MHEPTPDERLAARLRPSSRPLLRMRWEKLLFLHWSWNPAEIQAILPAGLHVDAFGGKAWLGVVPFYMRGVHPAGLPCLPWLSDFLELNVRTYVHDGSGIPGVWFTSLSCNQPMAVCGARTFFHLNYVHARMRATENRGSVAYESSRRDMEASRFCYEMPKVARSAEPGTLDFFLLERYVLFSANSAGRLFSGRVHHRPYLAGSGRLLEWTFGPAVADGFVCNGRAPDHVTMSERVEVEAWAIRQRPANGP